MILNINGKPVRYFTGTQLKDYIIKNDERKSFKLRFKDGYDFPYITVGRNPQTSMWVCAIINVGGKECFFTNTRNNIIQNKRNYWTDLPEISSRKIYWFEDSTSKSICNSKKVLDKPGCLNNPILLWLFEQSRFEEIVFNENLSPTNWVVSPEPLKQPELSLDKIIYSFKLDENPEEIVEISVPQKFWDRHWDFAQYKCNNLYGGGSVINRKFHHKVSGIFWQEKELVYPAGSEQEVIELLKNVELKKC